MFARPEAMLFPTPRERLLDAQGRAVVGADGLGFGEQLSRPADRVEDDELQDLASHA